MATRRAAVAVGGVGATAFVVWANEKTIRQSAVYWRVADAAAWSLRRFVADAETAHALTLKALSAGLGPIAPPLPEDVAACLSVRCLGKEFATPIGVAAGFDKRAEALSPLAAMGFGFAEVGGVTPAPQAGNPRPRIFRLPDHEAIINRVGLPSEGAEKVAQRLGEYYEGASSDKSSSFVVGVNCAKQTGVGDFASVASKVSECCDFVVINASCPNVSGGVVADVPELREAVRQTKKATTKPVLVKISPDLDDVAAVARVLLAERVDGVIVANTTKKHDFPETGGLSGRPLTQRTRHLVRDVYRATGGRLLIVGVGGVSSADDAYALVRSGATLVQLYTGLVYLGPSAALALHADLARLAQRDGFPTLHHALGADVRTE